MYGNRPPRILCPKRRGNAFCPPIASSFRRISAHLSLQVYNITRATPIRFMVSTYSMSLELLERTGFWETGDAGIGEDTHTALKLFYATDGEARTVPVYETFRCQCLYGDGFVDSCRQV